MHERWLEEELARRYRDAAPATLALLQERCEGVAADLVAAEAQLQAAEDVTSLRQAGQQQWYTVFFRLFWMAFDFVLSLPHKLV